MASPVIPSRAAPIRALSRSSLSVGTGPAAIVVTGRSGPGRWPATASRMCWSPAPRTMCAPTLAAASETRAAMDAAFCPPPLWARCRSRAAPRGAARAAGPDGCRAARLGLRTAVRDAGRRQRGRWTRRRHGPPAGPRGLGGARRTRPPGAGAAAAPPGPRVRPPRAAAAGRAAPGRAPRPRSRCHRPARSRRRRRAPGRYAHRRRACPPRGRHRPGQRPRHSAVQTPSQAPRSWPSPRGRTRPGPAGGRAARDPAPAGRAGAAEGGSGNLARSHHSRPATARAMQSPVSLRATPRRREAGPARQCNASHTSSHCASQSILMPDRGPETGAELIQAGRQVRPGHRSPADAQ